MRLCFLAEAGSVHTRRWAEHFVRRGDAVLVLSFRPGRIAGARILGVAPRRLGRAGYLLGWPRAWAAVRRFRPDVLHAHYATSYGLLGALLDWRPYVVSSWGSDVTGPQARGWPWPALLRFAFGRADAVCATSRFLADATRPFVRPGAEIAITPFGIDPERFRPAGAAPARVRPVTIGTARARLDAIYGVDVLLEAFARLGDADARLVVYGQGGDRARLTARAAALGLGDRVAFPGAVCHERMPEALRELDVFVLPSRVPEAFGVAAVEAAACGQPVVASAVGGLPEVVRHGQTGLLVRPDDPDALAEALRRLVDDPAQRARMGAAGRAMVLREYGWPENARRMEALYARLIADFGPISEQ